MCCINEKYKILYSRPSKTGGGAVEMSLKAKRINGPHSFITGEIFRKYHDFKVIVTVRNTFSRAVSFYRWDNWQKHKIIITAKQSKMVDQKWETFYEYIKRRKNSTLFNQYQYLSYYINNEAKPIANINILQFKNLEEDFNRLMSQIDSSIKLIQKNKKIPKLHYFGEYNYKSYYNNAITDLILEYGKTDIEKFGFCFEK